MEARNIEKINGADMTRLFENDSYIKVFEAQVSECQRVENKKNKELWMCTLTQTAFFPEGGGQNADCGTLNGIPVVDVQLKDNKIWHYIETPLPEGTHVHGEIDWKRRFDYMQQHSGEHIISGIIYKRYGYHNVGFHLGDDVVTLDLDGMLSSEQLQSIEYEANRAVILNKAITVSYPSKEELAQIDYRSKIDIDGQVRLVTIEDYDICACCAPHVALTGEIGLIKILSSQNYKGGVRLSMACGFRALEDYRMKQENIGAIGTLLSVRPYETQEAVQKVYDELQHARYELSAIKEQFILNKIQMAADENVNKITNESKSMNENINVVYFDDTLEGALIKRLMPQLTQRYEGYCCLFSGDDEHGYQYWIGSANEDARKLGELLKAHFTCRGGGRAELIQGKIEGRHDEIIDLLFTDKVVKF